MTQLSVREPSATDSSKAKTPTKPRRLADFGIIGRGFDVVAWEPRDAIASYTYDKAKSIRWRSQVVRLPDQVTLKQINKGHLREGEVSSEIRTAREFQADLSGSVGLEVTDPETSLAYSAEASTVNSLFTRSTKRTAFSVYTMDCDYCFFGLSDLDARKCISKSVAKLAGQVRTVDDAQAFFDRFGTHIVRSLDIGGQLGIRTVVRMTAESSKQLATSDLDIRGQVTTENEDYIAGDLGFHLRDQRTSALYRSISSNEIRVTGGDVTASSFDVWRESLRVSEIPTSAARLGAAMRVGGRAAAMVGGGGAESRATPMLSVVNLRFSELPDVLLAAKAIKRDRLPVWTEALQQALYGHNPFDNDVQNLVPDMYAERKLVPGETARFDMRGWMATYETYVGLEAVPGTRAEVRCKSDADPGGWTHGTLYAGETMQLVPKTAYMSAHMDVEFLSCTGTEPALLYAEHRLVSW